MNTGEIMDSIGQPAYDNKNKKEAHNKPSRRVRIGAAFAAIALALTGCSSPEAGASKVQPIPQEIQAAAKAEQKQAETLDEINNETVKMIRNLSLKNATAIVENTKNAPIENIIAKAKHVPGTIGDSYLYGYKLPSEVKGLNSEFLISLTRNPLTNNNMLAFTIATPLKDGEEIVSSSMDLESSNGVESIYSAALINGSLTQTSAEALIAEATNSDTIHRGDLFTSTYYHRINGTKDSSEMTKSIYFERGKPEVQGVTIITKGIPNLSDNPAKSRADLTAIREEIKTVLE